MDLGVPLLCIFQFTPLREGRLQTYIGYAWYEGISIHAPPRGATKSAGAALLRRLHFNSRPSARGDGDCAEPEPHGGYFNSRPSARGDASTM